MNVPVTYYFDADGDSYGDVCDNCPSISNAGQEDANNNGIGDVCEGLDQGTSTYATVTTPFAVYRLVGDKQYELSNHLGNVLSVVTDRKLYNLNLGTIAYLNSFETAVTADLVQLVAALTTPVTCPVSQ